MSIFTQSSFLTFKMDFHVRAKYLMDAWPLDCWTMLWAICLKLFGGGMRALRQRFTFSWRVVRKCGTSKMWREKNFSLQSSFCDTFHQLCVWNRLIRSGTLQNTFEELSPRFLPVISPRICCLGEITILSVRKDTWKSLELSIHDCNLRELSFF